MRLPDFLVIGAEKCGTTWLHAALGRHPQVFMSATKEIHFFNARMSNHEARTVFEDHGSDWYAAFFAEARPDQVAGEATPMYLCDEVAVGRIAEVLPGVRLVAILRDPVARARAHYDMAAAKGHVEGSFDDAVAAADERFVGRGLYGRQLERVGGFFAPSSLLVLFYEEVFADPAKAGRLVGAHIGVDEDAMADIFVADADSPRNAAAAYRSKRLLAFQSSLARRMQASPRGLRVASRLKKSGAADLLKRANRKSQPRFGERESSEAEEVLRANYRDDSVLLSGLLGRDLPWSC